jgi:hypothetical protein
VRHGDDGFAIFGGGLLTGLVIAFLIGSIFLQTNVDIYEWLEKWATSLGVFVAAFTLLISFMLSRASDRRRRISAISILSTDLSLVSEYASECFVLANLEKSVAKAKNDYDNISHVLSTSHLTFLDLQQALDSAKKSFLDAYTGTPDLDATCIGRLANAAAELGSKSISDLLNAYQIQNSRLKKHLINCENYCRGLPSSSIMMPRTSEHRAEDAMKLYILASREFNTARTGFNYNDLPISKEDLERAELLLPNM